MPFAGKFPTRVFWHVLYQDIREPFDAPRRLWDYCGQPNYQSLMRFYRIVKGTRLLQYLCGEFDRGGVFYLQKNITRNPEVHEKLAAVYHPFIGFGGSLSQMLSIPAQLKHLPWVHRLKIDDIEMPFYYSKDQIGLAERLDYQALYLRVYPKEVPKPAASLKPMSFQDYVQLAWNAPNGLNRDLVFHVEPQAGGFLQELQRQQAVAVERPPEVPLPIRRVWDAERRR